jgi:4'-phosphopantetheinyl transferase
MTGAPCRVWAFRNDCGIEATEVSLLDAAETTQAGRLKAKSDRDAFIKTRAALRSIVGREAGVPPRNVTFRYNSWGKPSIEAPGSDEIDFSVSHTKGLSAIALSHGGPVGVDVEPCRSCPDRIRIASDLFGVEVAKQLLAVETTRQDTVFLRLWTAGEAFVKARGLGFAGINGRVPIALAAVGSEDVVLRREATDRWSLTRLELGDEFIGHVIVGARPGEQAQSGLVELKTAAGFGSR